MVISHFNSRTGRAIMNKNVKKCHDDIEIYFQVKL